MGDYGGHRSEASPSMAWLEWFLGNAKWSNVGKQRVVKKHFLPPLSKKAFFQENHYHFELRDCL